MGIANKSKDSDDLVYVKEEIDVMATSKDKEEEEAVAVPAQQTLKGSKRSKKLKVKIYAREIRSPRKGIRPSRRCENWNHLISMVDEDEINELGLMDLVEPSTSPLDRLFMEEENMKIWNDFINRTEEEQEVILQSESCDLGDLDSTPVQEEAVDCVEKPVEPPLSDVQEDKRTAYPAYSGDECFQRIDGKLRSFLKKSKLPRGILQWVEDDLTAFFKEWPTSVYRRRMSSSYERLLLHTLCQYLDLLSYSFNDDVGERQTRVTNRNSFFVPPMSTLTRYLEERAEKH